MNPTERGVLDRLLQIPFPGRDEIVEQTKPGIVQVADHEGSLAFLVRSTAVAHVKQRVPIEAEAEDEDGVTLHALLHVVNGVVKELEFYKDDGSPIRTLPDPERWRVIELDSPR